MELSGVETMLPLHSAIASARLTSSLSVESRAWGLVPQGVFCCLLPLLLFVTVFLFGSKFLLANLAIA